MRKPYSWKKTVWKFLKRFILVGVAASAHLVPAAIECGEYLPLILAFGTGSLAAVKNYIKNRNPKGE